jgi:hypothetical protein
VFSAGFLKLASHLEVFLDGPVRQVFFNGNLLTTASSNCSSSTNASLTVVGGKQTALFEPFIYKMHYFTKTGSGRT